MFKIPSLVALKTKKLQRYFLWSGFEEQKRDHLVSWDLVCKTKEEGRLGFEKISIRNQTLLGKWL